jgi:hypothetical protein
MFQTGGPRRSGEFYQKIYKYGSTGLHMLLFRTRIRITAEMYKKFASGLAILYEHLFFSYAAFTAYTVI